MSPTDQVAEAMGRLDDETRALLELSSERKMSDDELADLLRLEREDVAERRRRAELRLRLEMGDVDGHPDKDEKAEPAERHSRRGWLALAAVAVVAAVVLVVVLASGGGEDSSKPEAQQSKPAPADENGQKAAAPSTGPVRTMQVLNDTHGRGTAQLVRSGNEAKLRLKLSGFLTPSGGGYSVWLYNSQDDARRLYATSDTAITRDLTLPKDYKSFQFVDVARAVPDLDSDHSGLSLLRVRVADLAG